MPTYLGFSTYNRAKKFSLNDFELVKQDLFNHFYIRRGEKLMNPNFGTIIWDILYEPYTEAIKMTIVDDIKKIATYDPRLAVESVDIIDFANGIIIEIEIRYLLTNEQSRLTLQFDRESSGLTAR